MKGSQQYIEQIEKDLDCNEFVLLSFPGKTAPTNSMLKLLPEVSWLTREDMPIHFVLTSQRILIYASPLYQVMTLDYSFELSEISTFTDVSGPLNGGIQFKLKDNRSYKFIFKKHRINEIIACLYNERL